MSGKGVLERVHRRRVHRLDEEVSEGRLDLWPETSVEIPDAIFHRRCRDVELVRLGGCGNGTLLSAIR